MAGFLDSLPGIGDALSGLGDFVGSIFGNGRPSLSAQLDVNKQLAKYQHDLNMDAWREQTAYNDPSAQMQRLKDAGLNPHSIAGSSSVSGNASPAPSSQSIQTPDLTNFQKKIDFSGLSKVGRAYAEANSIKQAYKQGELHLKNQEADYLLKQKQQLSADMDNLLKQQDYMQKGTLFEHDLEAKKIANRKAQEEYLAIQKNMSMVDAQIRKLNIESDILGHQEKKWAQGINPFASWQDQLVKQIINVVKNILEDNGETLTPKTQELIREDAIATLTTMADHYSGKKRISIPLYHLIRSMNSMDPGNGKGFIMGGM